MSNEPESIQVEYFQPLTKVSEPEEMTQAEHDEYERKVQEKLRLKD